MKILGIVGSRRKEGNTSILVREALDNESEMQKARRAGEKLFKTLKLRKKLEERLKKESIY